MSCSPEPARTRPLCSFQEASAPHRCGRNRRRHACTPDWLSFNLIFSVWGNSVIRRCDLFFRHLSLLLSFCFCIFLFFFWLCFCSNSVFPVFRYIPHAGQCQYGVSISDLDVWFLVTLSRDHHREWFLNPRVIRTSPCLSASLSTTTGLLLLLVATALVVVAIITVGNKVTQDRPRHQNKNTCHVRVSSGMLEVETTPGQCNSGDNVARFVPLQTGGKRPCPELIL